MRRSKWRPRVQHDQGDDVSDHADTIRDYVTNTERYDGQWHRLPTDDETLAALAALLAENQRLREALERVKREHPELAFYIDGVLAGDAE